MSSALARLVTVLAGGSAALALTACGAGFQPLTYEERNSANATEFEVGGLEVRDLAIEAPDELAHEAGETLEVSLFVANPTSEDDALVEVTTDAASSVEFERGGRSVDELEVPAKDALRGGSIALVDTTRELRAGEYVELTLRFANNGLATRLVPIRTPEGTPEREHSEEVHGEEGEH